MSLPPGGVGVGCLQLHVCDPDLPLSFGAPPHLLRVPGQHPGHRATGRWPWSPQRVCFSHRKPALDPQPHRSSRKGPAPEEAVDLLRKADLRVSDSTSED